MTQADVLIVGAGPTGLALALWLDAQGARVRIIDKSSGPGATSRAMVVQARTLELYRQLDLADGVIAGGHKTEGLQIWTNGKRRATIAFMDAGEDITPYPYVLIYPQDLHERFLVERLAARGIVVERETELLDFVDQGTGVEARVRLPDGSEAKCRARYLAGCDGARSTVRHVLGAGFEGGTYEQLFYVADVDGKSSLSNGEINISFEGPDFVLVAPYGEPGKLRFVGTVLPERVGGAGTLTFEDVGLGAVRALDIEVEKVNWFSTYHVHHRVTDRFRHGNVFLLGDAAHVHSPAGGQGMNTGIGDSINLAWKLAAVIKGEAPDSLLDSYEAERAVFARKLVETTDRAFTFVTARGSFAEFVRTRIAPIFAKIAYGFEPTREMIFRLVSQTMISYPESPLSAGTAGKVSGGDRLPFVRVDGKDNYEPLAAIGWQVHVYGEAKPELAAWCETRAIALRVFGWTERHGAAGLQRDAAYLLRPDTYVALAEPSADVPPLERYFQERGFVTTG
ncbi:FAD-dependent oxidoreductase [Brucella sp. IR073]|uniref:FAD-dependent oxidoreductase n=1 Tax=unclassified Brucella TaxID=2632610 RepID=UPI003B986566